MPQMFERRPDSSESSHIDPNSLRGAAVMGGVLLSHRSAICVAVRRPSGEIISRLRRRRRRSFLTGTAGQLPLLRGIVAALGWLSDYASASLFAFRQAEMFGTLTPAAVGAQQLPRPAAPLWTKWWTWRCVLSWLVWGALGLVLVFGGVPLLFGELATAAPGPWAALLCHVLGALAATLALAGYISLVSYSLSLRDLLGYHGALHQVRAACAAKAPLTLRGLRGCPHTDASCLTGTMLLLTPMAFLVSASAAEMSQLLHALLNAAGQGWGNLIGAALLRGVAVLVATGPYAELRLAASALCGEKTGLNRLRRGLNVWLCVATTTPPTEAHIEVALAAVLRLISAQQDSSEARDRALQLGSRKLSGACVRQRHHKRRIAPNNRAKEFYGAR